MNLHLSPSLQADGAWAYEIKFLTGRLVAEDVVRWARERLIADPHGDPMLDGAYRVRTLYFDTPEGDVYRRTDGYRVSKFRLRRYGRATVAFAEQKRRRGERVSKRRDVLDADDVPRLATESSVSPWFRDAVIRRGLAPSCLVEYRRFAFNGLTPEGRVRLTVDGPISAARHACWSLPEIGTPTVLLVDQNIVEIKFAEVLPNLLKELLERQPLVAGKVSKYRTAYEATETAIPARGYCA